MLALALAAAVPLQPIGPWSLEQSPSGCTLWRDYGPGSPIKVGFRPVGTGTSANLFVLASRGSAIIASGTGRVSVTPGDGTSETRFVRYVDPASGKLVTRAELYGSIYDRLADAETLSIDLKQPRQSFSIANAGKAIDMLRKCHIELLTVANVYVPRQQHATELSTVGDIQKLFTPGSYPKKMLESEKGAYVIAVLKVDRTGAVAACHISAGGGPDFNAETCKRAQRIRFTPPTDLNGKPVDTMFELRVNWGGLF